MKMYHYYVCVFISTLLLCAGVFSLPIFSYLPYSHTADFFFTVLDCGLCLGTAARALLAGLPDVISSNCRLLSTFRSSIILLTGMLHLVPLLFQQPHHSSLTDRLYCDKEFAGTQPIKAPLASF